MLFTSGCKIKLLDIDSSKYLMTFEGHTKEVVSAKVLDVNQLVSCSMDNTIQIWNISTGQCLRTILGQSYCIEILSKNS